MKTKFLSCLLSICILINFTSCHNKDTDNELKISSLDLPQQAAEFVKSYFPDVRYRLVTKKKHTDDDGSLYVVKLRNNFKIDFDSSGNCINIAGGHQAIPEELIPKKIGEYLTKNYPNLTIKALNRKKTSIQIYLLNDLELFFDLQENLLESNNKHY